MNLSAPPRTAPSGTAAGTSVGTGTGAGEAAAPVRVVGGALGTVIGVAARLRGTKPMHPVGAVLRGRLVRQGDADSGAEWIDTPGDDDVVVRLSRGAGTPAALPDVHGLALRHDGAGHDRFDGVTDVLLSTTFLAPVGRHLVSFHRSPGRGAYTSLMPYRGPRGPVLLAAVPYLRRRLPADPARLAAALAVEPLHLRLQWADELSPWRPFGWLEIGGSVEPGHVDVPLRFDPLAAPPGLAAYPWTAALRAPSYAAARETPADLRSTRPTGRPPRRPSP